MRKLAGYRLEHYRQGDISVGIWRKTFRKTVTQAPRRFVFIPGFGDSSFSWIPTFWMLRPTLQSGFDEVVLLDFPGCPGFRWNERFFSSLETLVSAVNGALESLKPHTLMGHSLGGALAGNYATLHPELDTLIVANPSGVFGGDPTEREHLNEIFQEASKGDWTSLRTRLFAKEPFWFRAVAPSIARFTQREEVREFLAGADLSGALDSRLHRIRARTFVLWGDEDQLCRRAWADHWIDGLTQATSKALLTFPRVGHSPHLEIPSKLARVLRQILTGQDPVRIAARCFSSSGVWSKVSEKNPPNRQKETSL